MNPPTILAPLPTTTNLYRVDSGGWLVCWPDRGSRASRWFARLTEALAFAVDKPGRIWIQRDPDADGPGEQLSRAKIRFMLDAVSFGERAP